MTDQIPADLAKRLHELVGKWETSASLVIENDVGATLDQCADELRALLPPPRKTLADMTPEERKECAWMLADLPDGGRMILDHNGSPGGVPLERVTPCFDLPRLAWPGDPDY